MLTKNDLAAIRSIFDLYKKDTDERFESLSDKLQKNTEELIELITDGFNALNYESRFLEQDSILNNHEKRIERIEEKVIKTN